MTKNEYNGWTNYETWNCKLWLDNDEGSQTTMRELAEECIDQADDIDEAKTLLADRIKELMDENNPLPDAGFYTDMLNAALSEVNWFEIASSYIDEADEDLLAKFKTEETE